METGQAEPEHEHQYEYDAIILLPAAYQEGEKGYEFPTIVSESREKVFAGKMRLLAAAEFYNSGITPLLILTGSNTLGEGKLSNAEAQADFLITKCHIPKDAIILAEPVGEAATWGNAKTIKKFIENNGFQYKNMAVLSSAFHLPRTAKMFKKEGLNLSFIPAEKILWQKSKHYQKLIKELYSSEEMDIRRHFEKAGIQALLSGAYKSQIEGSTN